MTTLDAYSGDSQIVVPLPPAETVDTVQIAADHFLSIALTAALTPVRRHHETLLSGAGDESAKRCKAVYVPGPDRLRLTLSPLYGIHRGEKIASFRAPDDVMAMILRCSRDQPLGMLHADSEAEPNLSTLISKALCAVLGSDRESIFQNIDAPASCAVEYDPDVDELSLTILPLHKCLTMALFDLGHEALSAAEVGQALELEPSLALRYMEGLTRIGSIARGVRYFRLSESRLDADAAARETRMVPAGEDARYSDG
jgi:hypothetical protein